MRLFINGSPREKKSYNILKDIMNESDKLISLANKDIKGCTGCNACLKEIDNYCILNDYMTTDIYPKIKEANKIIIASPLYMSNITGLLKNMIDRLYAFYNENYLEGKELYLILTGQCSEEVNSTEIKAITEYFEGISEWMNFKFTFLNYFSSGNTREVDNVKKTEQNYQEKINNIKEIINN